MDWSSYLYKATRITWRSIGWNFFLKCVFFWLARPQSHINRFSMLKNIIVTSYLITENQTGLYVPWIKLYLKCRYCEFNVPNIIEFVLNTTGATAPTGYPLVTPLCKSLSFGGCSYDGGAVTRFWFTEHSQWNWTDTHAIFSSCSS